MFQVTNWNAPKLPLSPFFAPFVLKGCHEATKFSGGGGDVVTRTADPAEGPTGGSSYHTPTPTTRLKGERRHPGGRSWPPPEGENAKNGSKSRSMTASEASRGLGAAAHSRAEKRRKEASQMRREKGCFWKKYNVTTPRVFYFARATILQPSRVFWLFEKPELRLNSAFTGCLNPPRGRVCSEVSAFKRQLYLVTVAKCWLVGERRLYMETEQDTDI